MLRCWAPGAGDDGVMGKSMNGMTGLYRPARNSRSRSSASTVLRSGRYFTLYQYGTAPICDTLLWPNDQFSSRTIQAGDLTGVGGLRLGECVVRRIRAGRG